MKPSPLATPYRMEALFFAGVELDFAELDFLEDDVPELDEPDFPLELDALELPDVLELVPELVDALFEELFLEPVELPDLLELTLPAALLLPEEALLLVLEVDAVPALASVAPDFRM